MFKIWVDGDTEVPVNVTLFPDNTSQVWKLSEEVFKQKYICVEWKFSHEGEIIQLAQLKTLFDQHDVKVDLLIKYLPYARQDKPVSNVTTFALHAFSKIINNLNFNVIQILDPHSEAALELITDAEDLYSYDVLQKIFKETQPDLICYPDAGAKTKYLKKYNHLVAPECVIYGDKERDQLTGHILKYNISGDCQDKTVLIVDDICDGGMTFILLAKQLLEAGAKEVNLFVTHGIFSKGLRCLRESGIKRIFTADGEAGEVQSQLTYRTL